MLTINEILSFHFARTQLITLILVRPRTLHLIPDSEVFPFGLLPENNKRKFSNSYHIGQGVWTSSLSSVSFLQS